MTGKLDGLDPSILAVLERLEQDFDQTIIVTSGKRAGLENDALVKLGTAKPNSAHLTGLAVDVAAPTSGDRFRLVLSALLSGVTRIGIGTTFVHLDVDTSKPQKVLWLYPPVGRPGA